MVRVDGLLDTGATGTGVRADLAAELALKPKGRRRVLTANGDIMATEYLFRIGFVCGRIDDPAFSPETILPFVLEREFPVFELNGQFPYAVLIGMDVIGLGDLSIARNGSAILTLY